MKEHCVFRLFIAKRPGNTGCRRRGKFSETPTGNNPKTTGGPNIETKRFQKNDCGFVCANCGKEVLPLGKSSRDHCPFCLCSLHLDVNPGDRASDCGGIMEPLRAEPDPRKSYILTFRCRKCGYIHRNKAAYGVEIQPDDLQKLISLTVSEKNF